MSKYMFEHKLSHVEFFVHTIWKSQMAKLFITAFQWVVGNQLHIAILGKIKYFEVRCEEGRLCLYDHVLTFPLVITKTIGSVSSTSISSSGTSIHS